MVRVFVRWLTKHPVNHNDSNDIAALEQWAERSIYDHEVNEAITILLDRADALSAAWFYYFVSKARHGMGSNELLMLQKSVLNAIARYRNSHYMSSSHFRSQKET